MDTPVRRGLESSNRQVDVTGRMRLTILAITLVAVGATGSWAQDTRALRKQASAGDAAAQYELARSYVDEAANALSEKRAMRDLKRAVEWYSKSAEQGFARAQFELGRLYILGRGVEPDPERGVELQIEAAEQGLPEAQFETGLNYMSGIVVEQDIELALDMFHKAAKQSHVPALKHLGTMYFQAVGVEKDLAQAHMWFSIAASNDDMASAGYLPVLESIMDEVQIDEARTLAAQWQTDHMAE